VALAQEPVQSLSQLYHTAWTTRDGAPSDVMALAQTPDGYLWLGGSAGLYRFDGVRFVPYQPTVGDAKGLVNVMRLLVARDGRLWVGSLSGAVSVIAGDSVRKYNDKDGLPTGSVVALAQDSTGAIWVGTPGGLATFDGGRWRGVGAEPGSTDARSSGIDEAASIVADRRGQLWIAARFGIFKRSRNGDRFELIERKPPQSSGAWDQYLAEAPDGTIWASDRRGLRIVDPVSRKSVSSLLVPPVPDALRVTIDRTGAIWVALHDGLRRIVPGTQPFIPQHERLSLEQGLSGGEVNAMLEDREGNLWVGTMSGIHRFRRSKLTRAELPPGTRGPFVLTAGDSGSVWIGPSSDRPMRASTTLQSVPTVQKRVDAAYVDREGTVWFGGDSGLWHSTRGGFTRVPLPKLHFVTVQAISGDDSGNIWVSLTRRDSAVYRREKDRWVGKGGQAGLPDGMAVVMTTDDFGRVWMGYYRQHAVAVWSHGAVRTFGEREGLNVGGVLALGARGERMWIGGEYGIAVVAGDRVRPITSKDGPALRVITGIAEVPNGDVWVHGTSGIARIVAAEVRRAMADTTYHVTAEWLDYRDGLDGTPDVGSPSVVEASDGRLWFGTQMELASLDPNRILRNPLPPPVAIERLTTGDRSFPIANGLTLPVHTRSLRIEFTALSLSMPERVRFRYKLTGSDEGWQESGGRREASYTNLGPGSYQFRVIAANEDGVWNERGATLDFTIAPSFTQTRWFVALWLLALTALAWLVYRVRMRQVAAGLRTRYEAAMSERSRIAQELHDTLLQGFTGITIQLRAIQRVLGQRPAEGAAALETALTSADVALRDARNSIWDMRAVELQGRDLPEALEGAVRSVMAGASVALEFTVRGDRRPLALLVETTALRIGREAVLNALKHADARNVSVLLEYGTKFLRLQIRDDGRGMHSGVAEAAAAEGHLGIAGMASRAHRAGGTMEIASESGRGTTVQASLPITS
jgi:signal transduction histidine kinase/ligand-binding sensor domain-containing protein